MTRRTGKKSIFRSLIVPMIFIMLFQAVLFYVAAVYGGIEESLSQNASDILSERLYSRKSEIETRFNNKWTDLDSCAAALDKQYAQYEQEHGKKALASDAALQVSFLSACSGELIDTLRYSETNGIFLILNNSPENTSDITGQAVELYGLCIRDMDQENNYIATEDLVIERSPSSIIDSLGCPLDSWWEAKYSFATEEAGDYYFAPLGAAWQNPKAKGADLAYLSSVHQISGSDPRMISYSIPLISEDGYPYGVLGVELSAQYLESLLPSRELNERDAGCYVLALQEGTSKDLEPIIGSGTTYKRCFGNEGSITLGEKASTGGYAVTGREGTRLYAMSSDLAVYNNNNPFASRQLVLLAMVEDAELFAYIGQIKTTLFVVALLSLLLGIAALAFVSRRFAAPITALARRVRSGEEFKGDSKLDRVGITEIDQLVDAIEDLNRDVSRDSARTEFFSRMSHDMRTPMNAIISFSSPELLEGTDEKVKDDYLDKIHSSGMYLLGLINEVLDLTKIESNKMELRSSAVCAAHLFDTTISVIDKLALKKGVSFTADIDVPEDLWITADELHLNQILINLLSNAVKFTPAGGKAQLEVRLENGEEDSGKTCCIVVSDTGIGMSEDFLKNLYTPFLQENTGLEGTGLGLSIAKKLVETMGGTIECKSKQGQGTSFSVTIPLTPISAQEAGAATAKTASAATDVSALAGKRVLVCEDNDINTVIVTNFLENMGVSVDIAVNGKDGVEMFRQSKPLYYGAILMDIRMPIMDGLEATREIRAMGREDAATVPIIAMTADAFVEDEETSIKAGMDAHLSKPIEPKKFYDTLLRLMQ